MLVLGYAGKTVALEAWIGFIIGMGGWFHILKEIFMSEAGGVAGECSQAFKEAFKQGSCALHEHARVVGASARVAQCLQVCGLDHLQIRVLIRGGEHKVGGRASSPPAPQQGCLG